MKKITPVELAEAFETALDSYLDPAQNPNVKNSEDAEILKKVLFPSGQLTQFILAQVFRQMELLDVES